MFLARDAWPLRDRTISLDRPRIVGIINVTPDSFSDGGQFRSVDAAVAHGERLVEEGADILDIGGESTRPGAAAVEIDEELLRVIPTIEALVRRFPGVPVSVDTTKSEVARAALDAGAQIVNDVSGGRFDAQMMRVCAERDAGVVLMHSRGSMGEMATYAHAQYGDDIVEEVSDEIRGRVAEALEGGVGRERIVIDPGIGFSKRSAHSLTILANLERFSTLGFPILIGVSRKRFIGELSAREIPAERVAGTIAANVAGLDRGARLFRVHDVKAHREALDVAWGILTAGRRPATM